MRSRGYMGLFSKKFSILKFVLILAVGVLALYMLFKGIINQNI